jgi:hypothetical protein
MLGRIRLCRACRRHDAQHLRRFVFHGAKRPERRPRPASCGASGSARRRSRGCGRRPSTRPVGGSRVSRHQAAVGLPEQATWRGYTDQTHESTPFGLREAGFPSRAAAIAAAVDARSVTAQHVFAHRLRMAAAFGGKLRGPQPMPTADDHARPQHPIDGAWRLAARCCACMAARTSCGGRATRSLGIWPRMHGV